MAEDHGPESEAKTRRKRIDPKIVAQGWQVEGYDQHVSLDYLDGKLICEGQTRRRIAELGIAAAANQAIATPQFECVNGQCKEFLRLHLQGETLRSLAAGGVRPNLSLGLIRDSEILLPPLAEQAELVRRVEALFSLSDSIEARLAYATSPGERTTPASLTRAFRGELT